MKFFWLLCALTLLVLPCAPVARRAEAAVSGQAPQCSDGVDNDADLLIDFPQDPDCDSALDDEEETVPRCADDLDNDGDGLVDYPADPGCHAALDDDESEPGFATGDVARVMVAVAATGTLNADACSPLRFTGGDGSELCPGSDVSCATCNSPTCGNAVPDDSRLFNVKQDVADAIARDDIEVALMRPHQEPRSFSCPTTDAAAGAGGWFGAATTACTGGFNSGDVLVSFAPTSQFSVSAYLDHTSYPFGPVGAPSGVPSPGRDYELRGTGERPLAGMLTSLHAYLGDVKASDPRSACRPYPVILVTDGAGTCPGDPITAATALRNQGSRVYAIGFAVDFGQQGELNAVAAAGGTGSATFVGTSQQLGQALDTIVSANRFPVESCNGLDDDCDGAIDETCGPIFGDGFE